ncbi:MAG: LemA protein [Hyphomicrobiaceae bacterium]|jgi:LemA protein
MGSIFLIISGIFALIICVVFFTIAWGVFSFNRLRALEARCKQAHSDVDVQLKRRGDLLPNLVETVRSFVGQENRLLDMLRDVQKHMNSHASINTRTASNANVTNALSNLFASLEQIPELRSSSHYVNLRNQMLDTEDKIEASRRFLNMATAEFNTSRTQFPGTIVASVAKIGERDGYNLGEERIFHADAPTIKLS